MMKRSAPFLLLCAFGVLLYGHTLQAPFYLDDNFAIAKSAAVQNLLLAASELFVRRGVSTFTFALNYWLGNFNVVGYHLVNIGIHLASACLVLLLLRRVFPHRAWPALFGALLFVAHPLQTQGVTYVVQRMTSLSAFFFLLSLYLFVRGRERLDTGAGFRDRRHLTCYISALVAGGLAILAKENAVVLPMALLLFGWLLRPVGEWRWHSLTLYTAPFLILPMVAVFAYVIFPQVFGPGIDTMGVSAQLRSMEGNSPLNYLVTQFSVLWIYIRMLFLPYGQALDHAYPVSRELLTFRSVAGGIGLLALLFLAWQMRRRQPVIACGIAWFFLTLAVESSVIPLDPLFEHRLYLPMFGFSMITTALLDLLPRPAFKMGVGVAILSALAVLTWQRNVLWNDPIGLYQQDLRVSPRNERAMFNLGEAYRAQGRAEEAERLLRGSIELNSGVEIGYVALKELYIAQGRTDDLIGMLHYAIEHVPENGMLYNELAFAYAKKGDIEMAASLLQRAIEINPEVSTTYFNLAQLYYLSREMELVEQHLRKALEIDSTHLEARAMLDELLKSKKPLPGAVHGELSGRDK